MKKIIYVLFTIILSLTIIQPVNASEIEIDENNLTNVHETNIYESEIVDENGQNHIIVYNYSTYEIYIDNTLVDCKIEFAPSTRTTVDYSTGVKLSYRIPWQGSAAILSGVITGLFGNAIAAVATITIIDVISAELPDVWTSYWQYQSKETYVSSYSGQSYKKGTYRQIYFYEGSLSGRKLAGPYGGGWWDPIRP